jgi:Spy/CpxP family protein refolding chaperone
MTMMGGDVPRRARLLGMFLLVSTFLAGALSGAAFDRLLAAREPAPAMRKAVEPSPRPAPVRPPQDIFDQIGVTADQRAQIDEILERRRIESDALGKTFQAMVDSTRAEIRAVLTDEQRAEYERLRAERRAQMRGRDDSGRGPDTGRGPDGGRSPDGDRSHEDGRRH